MRVVRRACAAGALVVAGAMAFAAPGSAAGDEAPATPDLAARILETEADTVARTVGVLRARASYPQRVSFAVGLMRTRQPADYDCSNVCDHRGLVLEVEPGLGGVQVGAGWGLVLGRRVGAGPFLTSYYVGLGVRGVALRTWGEASDDVRDQTFLGLEGQFSIASASFTLGLLHRVSDEPEADRWRVTGGLGWGF